MTEAVLGTPQNPYTIAPPRFVEDGLPYGAYCRCGKCGYVGRSTLVFDYHAENNGDSLHCETCNLGQSMYAVDQLLDEHIESGWLPPDPLGPGARGS